VSAGQGLIALVIIGLITVVAAAFVITDRRARRSGQAPPDRVDRLIAECRDNPPVTVAWPPQMQVPPQAGRLPQRVKRDDCGCLYLDGGLWSPCFLHDTRVIRAHIDRHADRWAADLWESQ
jgi:hypothetical protein